MSWAVTGAGMVTSVGADRDACFEAMCRGRSGNHPLREFREELFNVRHAYEIEDGEGDCAGRGGRASRWLRRAVAEALRGAGPIPPDARLAVLIGTGLRELRSLELWWTEEAGFSVDKLHFAGALHQELGSAPLVSTLSNACSASNFALGLGTDLLALDEADMVIVGGCDSITQSMFGLLDRVNPLHPERVQPFDRDRRGVLMGEGAAALVVETSEHAKARGAAVQAWIRGVGMGCDASHETAPDRDGIVRAIRDAHQRAGVGVDAIELILVHGTGTALNDRTEAVALREVFGDRLPGVPITGLKSMIGHTSGASGLVGVVTSIECMNRGRIPPTLGLTNAMDEAEGFDIVVGVSREVSPRVVQVNAFGFGGVNSVVLLERCEA